MKEKNTEVYADIIREYVKALIPHLSKNTYLEREYDSGDGDGHPYNKTIAWDGTHITINYYDGVIDCTDGKPFDNLVSEKNILEINNKDIMDIEEVLLLLAKCLLVWSDNQELIELRLDDAAISLYSMHKINED